jgi:hypothetical protein
LEDKLDVRFQLQIHKVIWNPNKRGVWDFNLTLLFGGILWREL